MHLRPILEKDRPALAELLSRTENFAREEVSVALELIDESIQTPECDYSTIVAVEGEGHGECCVGYLCYGPTPLTDHTMDLYWMAVDPAFRGNGIGRKLVEAFEGAVRRRGSRIVRIETSSKEGYGGTLEFYLRLGYAVVGRIPDFYREQDDLITLAKRL